MLRRVRSPLLLLLLSVLVHADVSTTQESIVPTSAPAMDENNNPVIFTDDPRNTTSPATTSPATTTNATTKATTPAANVTTEPPTTHVTNITTVAPTNHTNVTTALPTTAPTNATTIKPTTVVTTTTPAPTTTPLPNPYIGDYNVTDHQHTSVCLKARMGLQFSFRPHEGANFELINLDPNAVTPSGTCGGNFTDATLVLMSEKVKVQFTFSHKESKFYLSGLNFSMANGSGSSFVEGSSNLTFWEASLGSSYMCKKEQTCNITGNLILNTFELQVQPFNITNNKFSIAHECPLDDTSILIPIIVGAALAGLILIVVLAYVIGRRKTYSGYQTL